MFLNKSQFSIVTNSYHWVTALLLLFPITVVLIGSAASSILLILSLFGVWSLFCSRDKTRNLSQYEYRLLIVMVMFFVVAALAFFIGGINYQGFKELGRYFRFVLVIPILLLFLKLPVKDKVFWWGLVLGSCCVGVFAIFEACSPGFKRAQGVTHPILFGNLSLTMGVMSIFAIRYFRSLGKFYLLIPVIALILGLIASVLSGARGGWVALPAFFIIILVFYWPRMKLWQRCSVPLLIVLSAVAVISIPQFKMMERLNKVTRDLGSYEAGKKGSSVGLRFEMWKAALEGFKQSPVFGVGVGKYKDVVDQMADSGEIHIKAKRYSHPHNEYLFALASRGSLGLVVLLALFFVPLFNFWQLFKKVPLDKQYIVMTGFVLIVGYMHYALTEAIFNRSIPITFYTVYLAVITSILAGANHSLNSENNS